MHKRIISKTREIGKIGFWKCLPLERASMMHLRICNFFALELHKPLVEPEPKITNVDFGQSKQSPPRKWWLLLDRLDTRTSSESEDSLYSVVYDLRIVILLYSKRSIRLGDEVSFASANSILSHTYGLKLRCRLQCLVGQAKMPSWSEEVGLYCILPLLPVPLTQCFEL